MRDDETRKYYDNFSAVYSSERRGGYFGFINELEVRSLGKLPENATVLEAGCGTGLILDRVAKLKPGRLKGIDLSPGMIQDAINAGHEIICGSVLDMPFKNGEFDLVYSFKVLPHVPDLKKALAEIMRVTAENGCAIVELYNPYSMKYLGDIIRGAKNRVYLRHDTARDVINAAPPGTSVTPISGIRIFGPFAWMYQGVLGGIFRWLDEKCMYGPLQFFAGYRVYRITRRD